MALFTPRDLDCLRKLRRDVLTGKRNDGDPDGEMRERITNRLFPLAPGDPRRFRIRQQREDTGGMHQEIE